MYIVNAATMQALDQRTIEELGLPSMVLMERAALGTVAAMRQHLKGPGMLDEVHILAGTGNNGGDGLAIARMLHNQGIPVHIWLLGEDTKRSPDNALQLEICRRLGIDMGPINDENLTLYFGQDLVRATTIVDALFGVGLSRELEGQWARVIDLVNAHPAAKVAVDIPSGIHSDTGQVLGTAFRADLTVACACPKWGHLLDSALDYIGRLEVADIGIPPQYCGELGEEVLSASLVRNWKPGPRHKNSHKGSYGSVGIIAGSLGMSGAARMAAEAALQTGVGLVFLFVPASIQDQLAVALPEVQVVPLPEQAGQLALESLDILQRRLPDMDALLLGPGLGRSEPVARLLESLLANLIQPLVLDADALFHLATLASRPRHLSQSVIITPHPGELARLLQCDTPAIQADRVGFARQAADTFAAVTLLKGARSIVAAPEGRLYFNSCGNPGMARGGMGDVLAGLCAGLLAQGLDAAASAGLACFWHGLAGDYVAQDMPETSVTVQRLVAALPETWKRI
ncbi:MAG: NAD(P)H-hydrate dehydratase [Candidatus Sericytochromatia bacterium]